MWPGSLCDRQWRATCVPFGDAGWVVPIGELTAHPLQLSAGWQGSGTELCRALQPPELPCGHVLPEALLVSGLREAG